jgi:hypothetical protein
LNLITCTSGLQMILDDFDFTIIEGGGDFYS